MRDLVPELLEPLLVVFYGAIVAGLAAAGLGAELVGLSGMASGVDSTSLWLVYIGAVGLTAAVVVAKRRLVPQLGIAA